MAAPCVRNSLLAGSQLRRKRKRHAQRAQAKTLARPAHRPLGEGAGDPSSAGMVLGSNVYVPGARWSLRTSVRRWRSVCTRQREELLESPGSRLMPQLTAGTKLRSKTSA